MGPENKFEILGLRFDLPKEVGRERRDKGREVFEEKKHWMAIQAVLMHVQGESYRGVIVGCCAEADNPRVEGGYDFPAMHNFKPIRHEQHGWAKLCAEANICNIAIQDGAEYLPGLVVASQYVSVGKDRDDHNHSSKVLHSCMNCRFMFRDLEDAGFVSEETVMRFINDGSLLEEYVEEDPMTGEEKSRIRLKKQDLSEEDVAALPYEEMTMGEFLRLYPDDKRTESAIKYSV